MDLVQNPLVWLALAKIIWINLLLSGDNAVVIALAARGLPAHQQKAAVMFGSGAAVVLRVLLTVVAAKLLSLRYLQIAGGLLLLWIGVQLLGDEADAASPAQAPSSLLAAVRTILLADVVMSLDNVIAVAAAAQGNVVLMIAGLALSVPLVVFGSSMMIKVMGRYPSIVWAGAALIGWVGGETVADDAALQGVVRLLPWLPHAMAVLGAVLVLWVGRWHRQRPAPR